MRLKLETMTGTGNAMTSTPLSEQTPPTIFPAIVPGTMSPYLDSTTPTYILHHFVHLFTYLFNDIVSNSEYTATNDRILSRVAQSL
jgi:hypothetical protein